MQLIMYPQPYEIHLIISGVFGRMYQIPAVGAHVNGVLFLPFRKPFACLSFPCLLPSCTPGTVPRGGGESWHRCAVAGRRGRSPSPPSTVSAADFPQMPLFTFRKFSSIPTLLRAFINDGCWILLRDFSEFLETVSRFSLLVCPYGELHWFSKVKPTLHSWDKPHFVRSYYPSYVSVLRLLFHLIL